MAASLHSLTKDALIRRCTEKKLKRRGKGWVACGFQRSAPTKAELIAQLLSEEALARAEAAAKKDAESRRRARDVQRWIRAWLDNAYFMNREFACKDLEDELIAQHLRDYNSYVNLFNGALNPYGPPGDPTADKSFRDSIRSYFYELSPSSRQFWRKGGLARHPEGDYIGPGGFIPINKRLAKKNAEGGWSDQAATGRGDLWKVVRVLSGEWNEDACGPLPTPEQRRLNGTRIGWRGANSMINEGE